jgi:hypothetical protein
MSTIIQLFRALSIIPLLLGLCICLIERTARAEPFCAVTVILETPTHVPVTSTWGEVVNAKGKTVLREMINGDKWRICDFGFGAHSIRVGTNECFPVTISNVYLHLGYPVELHVLLNRCSGYPEYSNGCRIYFRVKSDKGEPLVGVRANKNESGESPMTDEFGRIEFPLLRGSTVRFSFSAAGHQTSNFDARCNQVELIEQEIILLPQH